MDKKQSIIIAFLIVIIGIIIFIVLINRHNKENNDIKDETNNSFYLILDKYSVWKYDNEWKLSNKSTVDNKEYYVYVNDKAFGKYTLLFGANWNLFDKNNNYIDYNGYLLAITPNTKIGITKYEESTLNEIDLSTIRGLINYNINLDSISPSQKVVADIDNNGVLDSIVIASNIDSFNQSKYYNLVYVNLNGQIKELVNNRIEPKDKLKEPIYSVEKVLLFDNNHYGNIVLHKTYFSQIGNPGNLMFEYDGNNYQLAIED